MSSWRKFLIVALCLPLTVGCEPGYVDPPAHLRSDELLGVWEADYGRDGVDTLILRGDGSFKQLFVQPAGDYVFQTEWNTWWVERVPSGELRVHLSGGRYFLAGIRIAELDGKDDPCPADIPWCGWEDMPRFFYDPFVGARVEMVHELILSVRVDSAGDLLMHHLWTSSDRGFALIGGEREVFRRTETP